MTMTSIKDIIEKKKFSLHLQDNDTKAIFILKDELQFCLDVLLDIAENDYPTYSSDTNIMTVLDIYKKYLG